jgi:7-carboxy-7-deazaguanine synthase
MKFSVNEVFPSIQGEGLLVGLPMNFIRFTKCNLACKWCDTNYASGREFSEKEILKKLEKKIKWVSLTGGEPLMEDDLLDLISYLKMEGFKICLETNGSLFKRKIFDSTDFISMDLKPPSSGNSQFSRKALDYCLSNPNKSQLKVVIVDKRDIAFFGKIYKEERESNYINWILQPETGSIKKINYSALIKEFPKVRIIPQIHRFLKVR